MTAHWVSQLDEPSLSIIAEDELMAVWVRNACQLATGVVRQGLGQARAVRNRKQLSAGAIGLFVIVRGGIRPGNNIPGTVGLADERRAHSRIRRGPLVATRRIGEKQD